MTDRTYRVQDNTLVHFTSTFYVVDVDTCERAHVGDVYDPEEAGMLCVMLDRGDNVQPEPRDL